MKINLVFSDWVVERTGQSVYCTEIGMELALGDFHSGTMFNAEIELEDYQGEFEAAAKEGIIPTFYATIQDSKEEAKR